MLCCSLTVVVALAATPDPEWQDRMRRYHDLWLMVGRAEGDKAIPLLQKIIDEDPTFWRAYRMLAEAYRQEGRIPEGERYFQSLAAKYPKNGYPYYGLARFQEILPGDHSKTAAQLYSQCALRTPRAWLCFPGATVLTQDADSLRTVVPVDETLPGYWLARLVQAVRMRDRDTALQHVRRALDAARALGDTDAEIAARAQMFLVLQMGNEPTAEGRPHLLEAVRLAESIGDADDSIRLQSMLASSEPRDLALANATLARARALGHLDWISNLSAILANMAEAAGDYENAARYMHDANEYEKLYRKGAWRPDANTIRYEGTYLFLAGRLDQALERLGEAIEAGKDCDCAHQVAFVYRSLGMVYTATGDYVKALQNYQTGVRLFLSKGMTWQAGADLGRIAQVYFELGDLHSALRYATDALASSQKHQDSALVERHLTLIGKIQVRNGNYAAAETTLQNALQFAGRVKDERSMAETCLRLADLESRRKHIAKATEFLDQAERHAAAVNGRTVLAEAAILRGDLTVQDPAQAAAFYETGLARANEALSADLATLSLQRLGHAAARAGRFEHAWQYLERAMQQLESVRSRVPTANLRAATVQQNWRIYEDAVQVLIQLHRRNPRQGFDCKALEVAERARARALLDALAEQKASVTRGLTRSQAAEKTRLQEVLARAVATLDRQDTAANREAVRVAESRVESWWAELRAANPALVELEYPKLLDASAAQDLARRVKASIVVYALGPTPAAWVVTPRGIRMVRLPASRAEIERLVMELRKTVAARPKTAADMAAFRPAATRLHQLLIAPLGLEPASPAVLAPDGILHYLPFDALLLPDGRFLVEDHELSLTPSLSVLSYLTAKAAGANHRSWDLLAYGNPSIPNADAGHSVLRDAYRSSGFLITTRLLNSEPEVRGIGNLFQPDRRILRLGADASESSIKNDAQLRRRRILHFATHALLDEITPARSGIVLAMPDRDRTQDGILRTSEVANLNLDADLVVLSACQTGLGKLTRAEGMMGLTRSFFQAGAHRVASSLWNVDDRATADFMTWFYQGMNVSSTPGAALREAKRKFLSSTSPVYRHPFFWAGFVISGQR